MTLENVVSWVANLIQIGSFIFVIILFLRARAELARYLRSRKTTVSERPWALAIGLGSDITGSVKEFLKDQGLDIQVESYAREGFISPDDFYPILKDLLRLKDKLTKVGVTEVHLFYKGPVTMAMAIGAVTDNWVPVKVYEYTKGTYQLDLVLEKETVKGLLIGEVTSEGESLLTGNPR